MCVGPLKPKAPTIPEPIAPAPKPESTAKAPVVGRKRAVAKRTTESRTSGGTKAARRFGTRSLRIPLLTPGSGGSSNLNY
tara:strand:- start:387 stop:626 length:240 start_codon:yes stop_codon:yes gene_type:complete